MRRAALCLSLAFGAASAGAAGFGSPGTAGADFLKIPSTTRPAGLAGAATALADGVEALEYNPARLSSLGGWDLGADQISWAAGINLEQVALGWGRQGWGGALSVLSLSTPDVPLTDSLGNQQGTFKQQDLAVTAGVGGSWGSFSAGVAGRGLQRTLDGYAYSGGEGDIGLGWSPWSGWHLGLAAQHLGSLGALADLADPTPMALRGGLGWENIFDGGLALSVELDGVQPRDASAQVRGGAQVVWNILSVRVGGQWSQDWDGRQPFTLGAGVRLGDVHLDYTFADVVGLGSTQRFGLSWSPGGAHRVQPKRAPVQLKAKRLGSDLLFSWQPVEGSQGYWVYLRKNKEGSLARANTAPLPASSVRLKRAARVKEVELAVASVGADGHEGPLSQTLKIQSGQQDAEGLEPPARLRLEEQGGVRRLMWDAASTRADQVFQVFISRRSGDSYAPLGRPQAGTSMELSPALTSQGIRYFVVQARRTSGAVDQDSIFSNEMEVHPR